jgi:hypothetical protein
MNSWECGFVCREPVWADGTSKILYVKTFVIFLDTFTRRLLSLLAKFWYETYSKWHQSKITQIKIPWFLEKGIKVGKNICTGKVFGHLENYHSAIILMLTIWYVSIQTSFGPDRKSGCTPKLSGQNFPWQIPVGYPSSPHWFCDMNLKNLICWNI